MYENGIGVTRTDEVRARRFYERACSAGEQRGCQRKGLYQKEDDERLEKEKAKENEKRKRDEETAAAERAKSEAIENQRQQERRDEEQREKRRREEERRQLEARREECKSECEYECESKRERVDTACRDVKSSWQNCMDVAYGNCMAGSGNSYYCQQFAGQSCPTTYALQHCSEYNSEIEQKCLVDCRRACQRQ